MSKRYVGWFLLGVLISIGGVAGAVAASRRRSHRVQMESVPDLDPREPVRA